MSWYRGRQGITVWGREEQEEEEEEERVECWKHKNVKKKKITLQILFFTFVTCCR